MRAHSHQNWPLFLAVAVAYPTYSKQMIALLSQIFLVALVFGLCSVGTGAQTATNTPLRSDSPQAEMEAAIHQVEKIVNQTVLAYRRTPGMRVSESSPGWFHEGAIKPNFNAVDVRATQETPYATKEYVTSDLNPNIVFIGRQLEFNSMTKYFYTNRSLPKKKLTQAEMEEINRLYRIIGRCEQQLAQKQNPQKPSAQADSDSSESGSTPGKRPRLLNPYLGGGAILVLALLLLSKYFLKAR